MKKQLEYAFRKYLTGNLDWEKLKMILMGRTLRNKMREEIAMRMFDRGNYSARIAQDAADDELGKFLNIEEKVIAGRRCVVWDTD